MINEQMINSRIKILINMFSFKKIINVVIIITFYLSTTSCGNFFRYTSAKDNPVKATERARKNVDEGRGVSLGDLAGKGGTTYEFSTSNPLWRASLEILDFIPLSSVNYSGGILITDWYSDGQQDESIKITVRFLSNEISANSIKVIIHKKNCNEINQCSIVELKSSIKDELTKKILVKAKTLEQESKQKK